LTIAGRTLSVSQDAQQSLPVAAVTLAADKGAPQPAGATVIWTATATGGTAPLQYKWWVFNGTTWSVARTWGTSNTFAWVPTSANANYQVGVWVRSNGNVADVLETSASAAFAIQPAAVATVALAAAKVAPQPVGTTVTWTATATGGNVLVQVVGLRQQHVDCRVRPRYGEYVRLNVSGWNLSYPVERLQQPI
jgi:cell wall-associated protease